MKKLLKFILAILLIGATASVLLTQRGSTARVTTAITTTKNG